ncbi:hypothetical protein QL285_047797 [Trifolium repens]|jgi:hypothetical protein|nr:hypothetical protein QL285_047797 [Trifolium repens]
MYLFFLYIKYKPFNTINLNSQTISQHLQFQVEVVQHGDSFYTMVGEPYINLFKNIIVRFALYLSHLPFYISPINISLKNYMTSKHHKEHLIVIESFESNCSSILQCYAKA